MTSPTSRSPVSRLRGAAIDVSPLRTSRDFRLLWGGQVISTLGRQLTTVALPYQVFQLTHSSLAVGLLGLAQVLPLITVSLAGGALADRVDRRHLLLVTQVGLCATSASLTLAALSGSPPLVLLYLLVALSAAVGGIDSPTRSAIVPNTVRPDQLRAAISLNVLAFTSTTIAGPAVAGLLIGHVGVAAAYGIDCATFVASLTAVLLLSPQPRGDHPRERPVEAVRNGLRFARGEQAILGGFAIDLAAMVFGMPRAVFPALAANTYHVSASGLGLLYSAIGAGAVAGAALTGWIGHVRAQGRVIIAAVGAWGIAIVVFGLSGSFPVALVCLACGGAADSVSAVCRSTMLQVLTPDHLRGRLNAVYFMVISGGPSLGDVETGVVGSIASPQVSVVSGGVLCLVGLAAACGAFPAVWRYRASTTTSAPPSETVAQDEAARLEH